MCIMFAVAAVSFVCGQVLGQRVTADVCAHRARLPVDDAEPVIFVQHRTCSVAQAKSPDGTAGGGRWSVSKHPPSISVSIRRSTRTQQTLLIHTHTQIIISDLRPFGARTRPSCLRILA